MRLHYNKGPVRLILKHVVQSNIAYFFFLTFFHTSLQTLIKMFLLLQSSLLIERQSIFSWLSSEGYKMFNAVVPALYLYFQHWICILSLHFRLSLFLHFMFSSRLATQFVLVELLLLNYQVVFQVVTLCSITSNPFFTLSTIYIS